MRLASVLLAVVLSPGLLRSQAGAQPAVSFGQLAQGGGANGSDQLQGWEFRTEKRVTIVALGLYDGSFNDVHGFVEPHEVGLWDASQRLIASVAIPTGTAAEYFDNFRYVPITPVTLEGGQTYVTAAFYPAPVSDYTALFVAGDLPPTFTIDPRITLTAYYAGLASSLSFPSSRWEGYIGAFGPNFIMQPRTENEIPFPVGEPRPPVSVPIDMLISANRSNAPVVLDASASTDPDGDALTYNWYESGELIASGVLVTNLFTVGGHVVTLVVSDGTASSSRPVPFRVVTLAQAVQGIIDRVQNSPADRNSLLVTLTAARDAFAAGDNEAGAQRLRVFERKISSSRSLSADGKRFLLLVADTILIFSEE